MTHALNCKTGGFITIRHNRVRDLLLTEICNDVEIEPPLQPLEGEIINGLTSVNARPDVRARRFWREGQNAFFDVRITNTNSESQRHLTSEKIFTKQEPEKKRDSITTELCVRGSRSLTTHSGNHAVDDFEIAFDYTLA